ncbi:MAG: PTS sugar transporter subunit IIA [Desulfosudaceae bacterium]
MPITSLIHEKNIVFLQETKPARIVARLAEVAFANSLVSDPDGFKTALLQREGQGSTGLGLGAALPHAARPDIKEMFLITALTSVAVPWNSLDGKPVRVIFGIGLPGSPADPEDTNNRYLRLVSQLMLIIKEEQRRQALLSADSAHQVRKIMTFSGQ